ncbi:hypothetical protein LAZ67_18000395 [Cordylochernes scorpioides]|uniref:RNase H type-1 domain-containing protein n=1 Tax=Cordylochernes scorpioides TaxID=51811 RepID=A0ABY6LF04_9ARAC|nr:hypothetical protein LAZ67_18000395 [Cordylochernes scorpioides]
MQRVWILRLLPLKHKAKCYYSRSLDEEFLFLLPLPYNGIKTQDQKETLDLILDWTFGNEESEEEISLTTCSLVDPPFSKREIKRTAFQVLEQEVPWSPDGIYNTIMKALRVWSPGVPTGIGTEVITDGSKSGFRIGAGICSNGELIFQESFPLRVDELVFSAELITIREALREKQRSSMVQNVLRRPRRFERRRACRTPEHFNNRRKN